MIRNWVRRGKLFGIRLFCEWSGWHFYLDLESRWSKQRPLARPAFKNSPTDFACVIATSFHCPLLGGADKGKGQIVPMSPTSQFLGRGRKEIRRGTFASRQRGKWTRIRRCRPPSRPSKVILGLVRLEKSDKSEKGKFRRPELEQLEKSPSGTWRQFRHNENGRRKER